MAEAEYEVFIRSPKVSQIAKRLKMSMGLDSVETDNRTIQTVVADDDINLLNQIITDIDKRAEVALTELESLTPFDAFKEILAGESLASVLKKILKPEAIKKLEGDGSEEVTERRKGGLNSIIGHFMDYAKDADILPKVQCQKCGKTMRYIDVKTKGGHPVKDQGMFGHIRGGCPYCGGPIDVPVRI